MPNGHGRKEYGGHKYADHDGTSDCKHGCGCTMGPSRSSGPAGINPFGLCPGNPKDGNPLGGKADYEYVVEERIRQLESRASTAEEKLRSVAPDKIELAERLQSVETELFERNQLLAELRRLITADS